MDRPKKIICTVINDLNYDQRMHRVCTSLVSAGNEVVLVGRVKEKSQPLASQTFQQKRILCMSNSGILMYMEFNIRLLLYLLFHKFDVVNAVDLDTIMPASIVSRLKNKAMVYDAHELFTEVPEIANRPYLKKIWTWIEEKFVPSAKACYTVGESIAKIYTEKYPQSFSVVRNVPVRQSTTSAFTGKKIILYQGAINAGRGLKEMIAAMTSLDSNIQLWIVGDGDLYEQIRAASLGTVAKQRIKMWGYVAPAELKEITRQAWIGINLLENNGLSYYYSLANRTFDFIQAGIPAIHMDFPEYATLNEKYDFSVLTKDLRIESIVQAVSKLEDPATYNRLKENCLIAANELCWENEESRLLDIYNSIK